MNMFISALNVDILTYCRTLWGCFQPQVATLGTAVLTLKISVVEVAASLALTTLCSIYHVCFFYLLALRQSSADGNSICFVWVI